MELHNRSCVVPSNAPALTDPFLEPAVPGRVLQERSGNRVNSYATLGASWKDSPPRTVDNLYPQGYGGAYFTGSVAAQLNGEKNEAQIQSEIRRLLKNLRRCEKYQKYRERQPKNAKQEEEKQIWPDYLEESFFKALVRWPPMGRRKLVLDGKPRGRNELIAETILRETGVERARKQVSSHIQVLKGLCVDHPAILRYMPKEDPEAKKGQSSAHHRGGQGLRSPSDSPSKHDYSKSLLSGFDDRKLQPRAGYGSPYRFTDFAIYIQDRSKTPVHYFTHLASPETARLEDLNVSNLSAWRQQYPELRFHDPAQWEHRQIIVCDASIKVMTEWIPDAVAAVDYTIQSQVGLSMYESLQCDTSFYDNGILADLKDERKQATNPISRECSFDAETGHAVVHFGSLFWAHWMRDTWHKSRAARNTQDEGVKSKKLVELRRSLQAMTAVQDLYGSKHGTEKAQCFLTILWRFHQTKAHNETGVMKWRTVNFRPTGVDQAQQWAKAEDSHASLVTTINNTSTSEALSSIYPSLPLDYTHHHQSFSHPHHMNHDAHDPPPLDFDDLSSIALDAMHDYSHPNSATAPSLSTDYSQAHSLPSLAQSQDTIDRGASGTQSQPFHDVNDIDFSGGHIGLVLEPAIDLTPYENYGTHAGYHEQHQHQHQHHQHDVHLEGGQDMHLHLHGNGDANGGDDGFGDLGLNLAGVFPLPQKSWPFDNLVERLEGVVEGGRPFGIDDMGGEHHHAQHAQLSASHHGHGHHESDLDIVGHGVLDNGSLGDGLWKLQSGFGEDTGVGALDGDAGLGGKEGGGDGEGDQGLRMLELMEGERGRKDSFQGF